MEQLFYAKVLLIVNNEQEIFSYLYSWGLEVYQCKNHLQALTLMEDNEFDLVLICSDLKDINGLKFSRLVRRREKESCAYSSYTYLILIGYEEERLEIIETDFWDLDDFIIRPFLFAELRWRLAAGIKRVRKYRELENKEQVLYRQNVLNKHAFYHCISAELNRSWRKQGQISLLLIQLKGLQFMGLNYGQSWMNWLDNYLIEMLRKYLRDYDQVASLRKGVWCLMIPDSSRQGLQGVVNRLKDDMQELLDFNTGQFSNIELLMWGILLNLELSDYKKRFAFDHFWEWLIENSEFDFSKREITAATLSEDGVKINPSLLLS